MFLAILNSVQDLERNGFGAVFSSVGRAHAPCVEAIVLTAGSPGSNPTPSGPILRVSPPLSASHFLCLSLSIVLSIKGEKAQKIYKTQKKRFSHGWRVNFQRTPKKKRASFSTISSVSTKEKKGASSFIKEKHILLKPSCFDFSLNQSYISENYHIK